MELIRQHPNVSLLKGEGPALTIRRMIEETEGRLTVFNGRGGLELPDNLRAGCAGLIPAPDCFDRQIRIFELMRSGKPEDEAAADKAAADEAAVARPQRQRSRWNRYRNSSSH